MDVASHKKDQAIFYVYEHWRPDKKECFHVGKGHGRRAFAFSKRNRHHRNVVGYLRGLGLEPEVRIVFDELFEKDALRLEVAWISFWRGQGAPLTNATEGGEGVCGLRHSEETKAKLSALASVSLTGRPCSPETREKISAAQRGRLKGPNPEHSARLKGRRLSAEHRAKIGAAGRGRVDPPEVRARRAESNRGRKASEETKILLSLSHRGQKPSAENLAKRSASLKASWAKRKGA